MKKLFFKIVSFILILTFVSSLFACRSESEPVFYTIVYEADEGGNLTGELIQTVEKGGDGTEVIVKENEGYAFRGWSDGHGAMERIDKNVRANIAVTAKFEKLPTEENNNIAVNYIAGVGGNIRGVANQSVKPGDDAKAVTAIPDDGYRFVRWSDNATIMPFRMDASVTDAINVTAEFEKFTEEATVYKILLVYVTEVNGVFQNNGEDITVNFKMNDIERQVCEFMAFNFEIALNSMLDGMVKFEVDTYFTTVPLDESNFRESGNGPVVKAPDIPEVIPILRKYRGTITIFGLSDYDIELLTASGWGGDTHAAVALKGMYPGRFETTEVLYCELGLMLDFENPRSNFLVVLEGFIGTYIHEFTHTVETGFWPYSIYEYHAAISGVGGIPKIILERTKLYLLNELIIDGEKVGIPHGFWKGEFDVNVQYFSGLKSYGMDSKINGKVRVTDEDGNVYESWIVSIKIRYGSSVEITSIPDDGYRFVMWSDGVTDQTRQITDIISLVPIIAILEKIS